MAASAILATSGELNALTALVDDEGVDVTFKRRDGSRTLDVQVKSRFYDEGGSKALRKELRFIADIREATFRPRDDLFMLFVAVNAKEVEMGPVWFVPSITLDENGIRLNPKSTGPQVRFDASAKPNSKDKWRPYRMTKSDLPQAILEALKPGS